jgi:hypothetical protein
MSKPTLVKFTRAGFSGERTLNADGTFSEAEAKEVIEDLMQILEPDNLLIPVITDATRGVRPGRAEESPAQLAKRLGFSQLSYEIDGTVRTIIS